MARRSRTRGGGGFHTFFIFDRDLCLRLVLFQCSICLFTNAYLFFASTKMLPEGLAQALNPTAPSSLPVVEDPLPDYPFPPPPPPPPYRRTSFTDRLPKKRVVIYGICALFLTTFIVALNLTVNFFDKLSRNESLWHYLTDKNACEEPCDVVSLLMRRINQTHVYFHCICRTCFQESLVNPQTLISRYTD